MDIKEIDIKKLREDLYLSLEAHTPNRTVVRTVSLITSIFLLLSIIAYRENGLFLKIILLFLSITMFFNPTFHLPDARKGADFLIECLTNYKAYVMGTLETDVIQNINREKIDKVISKYIPKLIKLRSGFNFTAYIPIFSIIYAGALERFKIDGENSYVRKILGKGLYKFSNENLELDLKNISNS